MSKFLADRHGLGAMSRAHREIIHKARLLRRLADGLTAADTDHYLIRDAQRVIEAIEALVRLHNVQEEDIYEHAIGSYICCTRGRKWYPLQSMLFDARL